MDLLQSWVRYPLDREAFLREYPDYWLSSPSVVFPTFLAYGLACYLLTRFGKGRRAIDVPRWILVIHNAIQAYSSPQAVLGTPFSGNYNFDGKRSNVCEHFVMGFVRLFTLSKYYDLVDTLFLALMKKDQQMSFLHCSHHCLVPVAVWYGMWYSPAGDSYAPALVNSFVHLVMYSYYLLAALHMRCPWKQHLTQLQLAQFAFLFLYGLNCWRLGTIAIQTTAVNSFVQAAMLILFGQFYLHTYSKHKAGSSGSSGSGGGGGNKTKTLGLDDNDGLATTKSHSEGLTQRKPIPLQEATTAVL